MTEHKQLALETLNEVKRIYNESNSELLCGGFWSDFMKLVNDQIKQIEETTF